MDHLGSTPVRKVPTSFYMVFRKFSFLLSHIETVVYCLLGGMQATGSGGPAGKSFSTVVVLFSQAS